MNKPGLQKINYVVVAAGILQCKGKILLTRRKVEVHQGGLWEFPGGKQEASETLVECLRREFKEEVDIEIGEVQPFYVLRHSYPEKQVELHFFTCSQFQGTPKPLECDEMAWVSIDELASYPFPEADRLVVQKILEG